MDTYWWKILCLSSFKKGFSHSNCDLNWHLRSQSRSSSQKHKLTEKLIFVNFAEKYFSEKIAWKDTYYLIEVKSLMFLKYTMLNFHENKLLIYIYWYKSTRMKLLLHHYWNWDFKQAILINVKIMYYYFLEKFHISNVFLNKYGTFCYRYIY